MSEIGYELERAIDVFLSRCHAGVLSDLTIDEMKEALDEMKEALEFMKSNYPE